MRSRHARGIQGTSSGRADRGPDVPARSGPPALEPVQDLGADVMYKTVAGDVFPFLQQYGQQVGGDGSTYTDHMKDARFTIPTPALLSKVVDMLDHIPMDQRDTNGRFRTPRHIIELMVAMTAPMPNDEICDPACGTSGFLVAASEYVHQGDIGCLRPLGQDQHGRPVSPRPAQFLADCLRDCREVTTL